MLSMKRGLLPWVALAVLAGCDGAAVVGTDIDTDGDGVADSNDAYAEDARCHQAGDGNGEQCYWALIEQESAPLLYTHRQDVAFIYLPSTHQLLPFEGSENRFLAPIQTDSEKRLVTVTATEQLKTVYGAYSDGAIVAISPGHPERLVTQLDVPSYELYVNGGVLVTQAPYPPDGFIYIEASTGERLTLDTSEEKIHPLGHSLAGKLIGRSLVSDNLYALSLRLGDSDSPLALNYIDVTTYPVDYSRVLDSDNYSLPDSGTGCFEEFSRGELHWEKQKTLVSRDGRELFHRGFPYLNADNKTVIPPVFSGREILSLPDGYLTIRDDVRRPIPVDSGGISYGVVVEYWGKDFKLKGSKSFAGKHVKLLGDGSRYTLLTQTSCGHINKYLVNLDDISKSDPPQQSNNPTGFHIFHVIRDLKNSGEEPYLVLDDGIVYLVDGFSQTVWRWSLAEAKYLEPIRMGAGYNHAFLKYWNSATYIPASKSFFFRYDRPGYSDQLSDIAYAASEYSVLDISESSPKERLLFTQQCFSEAPKLKKGGVDFPCDVHAAGHHLVVGGDIFDWEGSLVHSLNIPSNELIDAEISYGSKVGVGGGDYLFVSSDLTRVFGFRDSNFMNELSGELIFNDDQSDALKSSLFLNDSADVIATPIGNVYQFGGFVGVPQSCDAEGVPDDTLIECPGPSFSLEVNSLGKVDSFEEAVWLDESQLITINSAYDEQCEIRHYHSSISGVELTNSQLVDGLCWKIFKDDSDSHQALIVSYTADQLVFSRY